MLESPVSSGAPPGHPRSVRVSAVDSRRTAPSPPSIDDPGLGSSKPSAAPSKEQEEAENEIQRLNELRLGDDISYEEYMGYFKQLPDEPDVDTYTQLDDVQLKELNNRHALYRTKYYQVRSVVPSSSVIYTL